MADKNMPENNKSDILVILENIDQMLQCFTKMVNGYARNIQEVAIAVEAMTLAQKLRLAACRWQYWLPFKEACDVNFNWWEKGWNIGVTLSMVARIEKRIMMIYRSSPRKRISLLTSISIECA